MVAAAILAMALTPTKFNAATAPKVNLEALIPKHFGEWSMSEAQEIMLISPEQEATLKQIYNQTLTRTYVNSNGQQVMLSIAYGGDQSDSMQVHRPEVCYPAQGFQVFKKTDGIINTGFGSIPVVRLVATQKERVEPITYWIMVGNTVAENKFWWKIAQLKISLTGKIPDGLIFRVSTIDADEGQAYRIQDVFINELLHSLNPYQRSRLIGNI
jgi:EpsI family protein